MTVIKSSLKWLFMMIYIIFYAFIKKYFIFKDFRKNMNIAHVTCEPWTRVWTPRVPGSRWGFGEDFVSINWGLGVNWGWPSENLQVDLAVKRGACLGQ